MIGQEMFDAASAALRDIARMTDSVDMGLLPGAEPLSWKEQAVQFIDDLPDLLSKGPRYRVIEQTYGQGQADRYLEEMGREIWRPRRRRAPL